jgi:hypothetical protein
MGGGFTIYPALTHKSPIFLYAPGPEKQRLAMLPSDGFELNYRLNCDWNRRIKLWAWMRLSIISGLLSGLTAPGLGHHLLFSIQRSI